MAIAQVAQHSIRPKTRSLTRKEVFKPVLTNSTDVEWPSIPKHGRVQILEALLEMLSGVSEYREGMRRPNGKRRKISHLAEELDEANVEGTEKKAEALGSAREHTIALRNGKSIAIQRHVLTSEAPAGSPNTIEAPEILQHLIVGINSVQSWLEAYIAEEKGYVPKERPRQKTARRVRKKPKKAESQLRLNTSTTSASYEYLKALQRHIIEDGVPLGPGRPRPSGATRTDVSEKIRQSPVESGFRKINTLFPDLGQFAHSCKNDSPPLASLPMAHAVLSLLENYDPKTVRKLKRQAEKERRAASHKSRLQRDAALRSASLHSPRFRRPDASVILLSQQSSNETSGTPRTEASANSITSGIRQTHRKAALANRSDPIRYIFVCRPDIEPVELVSHLPTTVCAANGFLARDNPEEGIYLVQLDKGAEAVLAKALGIRKCAVLGVKRSAGNHHALDQLIRHHIQTPLRAAHLDPTPFSRVAPFLPMHIKHLLTSVPSDPKAVRAERRQAKRKRDDA